MDPASWLTAVHSSDNLKYDEKMVASAIALHMDESGTANVSDEVLAETVELLKETDERISKAKTEEQHVEAVEFYIDGITRLLRIAPDS